MQLRFEKMLKSAILNLKITEDAKLPVIHQETEPGVLLETNKNYIFVRVSVFGFKFDGKDVISISEKAPVFKNLKSKRIGNNIFKIKNII